jgi:uncharacterized protein
MNNFPCTSCGLCCRKLHLNNLYAELDKGNGICKHLDEVTNLCQIYENRPLLCRIDDCYTTFYEQAHTKKEFYLLNAENCLTWQIEANILKEARIDLRKIKKVKI